MLCMVHFSTGTQQQKQVYNCKANNMGMVHDEWANNLQILANKLPYMIKQLKDVKLTAKITVQQLHNTSSTATVFMWAACIILLW